MTELFEGQLRVKVIVRLNIDERYYPKVLKSTELVCVDCSEILKKLIYRKSSRVQKFLEFINEKHSRW